MTALQSVATKWKQQSLERHPGRCHTRHTRHEQESGQCGQADHAVHTTAEAFCWVCGSGPRDFRSSGHNLALARCRADDPGNANRATEAASSKVKELQSIFVYLEQASRNPLGSWTGRASTHQRHRKDEYNAKPGDRQ